MVRSSLPLDGQDRVAQRLGIETLAIGAPQEAIVGVDCRVSGVARGRLAVDRAHHDQLVELLEGAAAIAELHRQPVEQLRMRGQRAHVTEIVGRVDDSGSEVIMPDAIDDGSPGEHVVRVGDPAREIGAPLAFGTLSGRTGSAD